MKKTNESLIKKCFFILAFTLLTISLFGQVTLISRDSDDYPEAAFSPECASSPFGSCVITLPPATFGEDYTFYVKLKTHNILLDTIDPYLNNCTGAQIPTIVLNPSDSIMTITIPSSSICRASTTNKEIIATLSIEDDMGTPDSQEFKIPLPRNPIKVAMVLDISGSMSLPTPGDNLDFTPRIDVLKVAVKSFAEKLEELRHPGDSLALSYFTTYVIQPDFPTIQNFIGITKSTYEPDSERTSSIIDTDMVARNPLYMTALGLGLLDGKLKLRGNATDPDSAQKLYWYLLMAYKILTPK